MGVIQKAFSVSSAEMSRRVNRGGWRRAAATRPDSGMVTAEIAVSLPALCLVVAALAWMVALAVGQGVVVQAAREGARAAARGDSAAEVRSRVLQLAPGSTVSISHRGDLLVVTASRPGPQRPSDLLRRARLADSAPQRRARGAAVKTLPGQRAPAGRPGNCFRSAGGRWRRGGRDRGPGGGVIGEQGSLVLIVGLLLGSGPGCAAAGRGNGAADADRSRGRPGGAGRRFLSAVRHRLRVRLPRPGRRGQRSAAGLLPTVGGGALGGGQYAHRGRLRRVGGVHRPDAGAGSRRAGGHGA